MDIEETALPGVGVKHEFTSAAGKRVGVLSHRSGRRDIAVYDDEDPDACIEVLVMTPEEAEALAELLGAPKIVERIANLRAQVEGLVSEGLVVRSESVVVGHSISERLPRSQTGASIVAVIRGSEMVVSPGPDFKIVVADTVVAVGTREGVQRVARLVAGR